MLKKSGERNRPASTRAGDKSDLQGTKEMKSLKAFLHHTSKLSKINIPKDSSDDSEEEYVL